MTDTKPSLRETLERRLEELRREYRTGQEQMTALEQRRRDLEATMLRLAGAIQVLEETVAQEE
ncbi:hypothetical protein [Paramagnetospirillum magneticum]|uniref:Uncharacterized protein n=1 Tax=Paramagnetospirillum magneticum (strain ATCC 700264 / AMB-1) TaxID=342108 RepID=Q2W626_PARM1|nr:hypothetical protein [Paramagnetospirillum magneticum]BAE50699.1 hypothetical protein amb1895 [Paramagnetospirillum magneticum AMB-1]